MKVSARADDPGDDIMHVKFYCDLAVSDIWQNKKRKIMEKLKKNRLWPHAYVVALSQGKQNHLEIFSGILLRQHVYDHAELFVVAVTDGYMGALYFTESLAEQVFRETGGANIRKYILDRQAEYERTGR